MSKLLGLAGASGQTRFRRELALAAVLYALMLYGGHHLDPFQRLMLGQYLIPVPMAVGLSFMWGQGGILSFGQSLFYGLGGYSYGIVAINLANEWNLTNTALLIGLLVPLMVAVIVGWFMFYGRLSQVYVAIIMFVLTIMAYSFMAQTAGSQWHIGKAFLGGTNGLGSSGGEVTPPPSLVMGARSANIDFSNESLAFFSLVLGVSVLSILFVRYLIQSNWGLVMRGIRSNPVRAAAMGYDERPIRLFAFVLGAGYAALSGVLYVSWSNFITPDVFNVAAAVLPVLWVTIGGIESVIGSAIAAATLSWLTLWLATRGNLSDIVIGGLLVAVAVLLPRGIGPSLVGWLRRGRRRGGPVPNNLAAVLDMGSGAVASDVPANEATAPAPAAASADALLEVGNIGKRWRGVVALSSVSISVRRGETICVIGPNGAGKSTLLKCITGDNRVDGGRILFAGQDVTNKSKHERARTGISIKYQNSGTFIGITALENLRLANISPARRGTSARAGGQGIESLFQRRAEYHDPAWHRMVDDLSHGDRQLLDILMTFECNPRLVILDEPVAGLSLGESAEVAQLIKRLASRTGAAVLITEHDMSFVRMMESRVVVLNRGQVLASGTYEEMMDDARVKKVYLGD